MFDPIGKLALGLATGLIFGWLLQKGRVAKAQVIVGQFLFQDWTVVKVMGTAVVVGSIGIYAMLPAGLVALHIKPLLWGGVIAGGVCFGIGMAVFGYCPGTSVAACGEGRRDAMVGVMGMLAGAGLYVGLYPVSKPLMRRWGDAGETTLPEVTGSSAWLWITGLAVVAMVSIFMSLRSNWRQRLGQSRGNASFQRLPHREL